MRSVILVFLLVSLLSGAHAQTCRTNDLSCEYDGDSVSLLDNCGAITIGSGSSSLTIGNSTGLTDIVGSPVNINGVAQRVFAKFDKTSGQLCAIGVETALTGWTASISVGGSDAPYMNSATEARVNVAGHYRVCYYIRHFSLMDVNNYCAGHIEIDGTGIYAYSRMSTSRTDERCRVQACESFDLTTTNDIEIMAFNPWVAETFCSATSSISACSFTIERVD
jgi:hypothetical protein